MAVRIAHVTFNSTQATHLADWWAFAVGSTVQDAYGGSFLTVAVPGAVTLAFQQVEDPTPGPRRLHLDLEADDLDTEVERLGARGARALARHGDPDRFRWVVLSDPDGNEFCISTPH